MDEYFEIEYGLDNNTLKAIERNQSKLLSRISLLLIELGGNNYDVFDERERW